MVPVGERALPGVRVEVAAQPIHLRCRHDAVVRLVIGAAVVVAVRVQSDDVPLAEVVRVVARRRPCRGAEVLEVAVRGAALVVLVVPRDRVEWDVERRARDSAPRVVERARRVELGQRPVVVLLVTERSDSARQQLLEQRRRGRLLTRVRARRRARLARDVARRGEHGIGSARRARIHGQKSGDRHGGRGLRSQEPARSHLMSLGPATAHFHHHSARSVRSRTAARGSCSGYCDELVTSGSAACGLPLSP